MKERIDAVSRVFWATVGAALVVIAVGVPLGDDARVMQVLEELQAFEAGFPRQKLEQDLLAAAKAQGMVAPTAVIEAAGGRGVPPLSLKSGIAPIEPRAALGLATLARVEALSEPGATLDIATPDAKSIGTALGWRLARMAGERYEVVDIQLSDATAKASEVEREAQTAQARVALIDANQALKQATDKHTAAHDLWEARRKWKASWKMILRANEKRVEAKKALEAADDDRGAKRDAYDALATAAMKFDASASGAQQGGAEKSGAEKGGAEESGAGDGGVVVVRVVEQPSGKSHALKLPVRLERRAVPVPHLTGAGFPVAKEMGYWDAIKDMKPAAAEAYVLDRFSWHYAHVQVGPVKLGGMTVLQLAPLLVLVFLGQIRKRAQGVGATYNPFDRPSGEDLPRVGMGSVVVNMLALIGLPLAGCFLCSWSLLQIGHIPVVPVITAMCVIAMGGFAQGSLTELMELRDAVVRSHSNPPPAPSAR